MQTETALKIQIYTMQTAAEAVAAATAGVDYLGVTPSNRGLPGEITFAKAREIVDALEGKAQRVALSVESNLEDIAAMVEAVRPDVLHLCGDIALVTPEQVKVLRSRLSAEHPALRILQAIPMTGPEALDQAAAFEPFVDMFILDSVAPHIGGIGAAGVTHDWSLSREIVARSRLPVILAGGLRPDNVRAAIEAVRPWAVDSLTHTNRPLPEGGFRKDLDKIAAFVEAARAT
ncbi:phosphoribosylanthranilate isomerase [Sinorhizobium medicae]|nr:phosphoribosylanthranilate isomerase [Sinorhizobium medicae]MDX1206404.1 phosphoribosylanthranilate isomerase [Sinorhizobium medicae]MDX1226145.1 phosphoribosylanthranilate isomerase [Sinorhizobium medicae]RVI92600.1 phosphoribosylanthranilate isomerase [Sinorhizobium medicae]RVJ55446.1 phosphoribosylanthranilate isomerase [Sinorhizobium medicae]